MAKKNLCEQRDLCCAELEQLEAALLLEKSKPLANKIACLRIERKITACSDRLAAINLQIDGLR